MGIILWIVFGALVGWIASIIMKTDSQQGTILNIVVGIVGAVVGGWVMGTVGESGVSGVSGFNLYIFLVALVGSVILIAVVKALRHA